MQQSNNKLVWKYFWEQKWKEISKVLLIAFIIISILGLIAQIGWQCKTHKTGEMEDCSDILVRECPVTICDIPYEPQIPYWALYSGIITTSFWLLFGVRYWIKSNWEKAKQKVKQENCDHKFDIYGYCKLCEIDKDDIKEDN